MDQLNPNRNPSKFQLFLVSLGVITLFLVIAINAVIAVLVGRFPFFDNVSNAKGTMSYEVFSNISKDDLKTFTLALEIDGSENLEFFGNEGILSIPTCSGEKQNKICLDIASKEPIRYGSKLGVVNFTLNDSTQIIEVTGSFESGENREIIYNKFLILGSDYQAISFILNVQSYLILISFVFIILGFLRINFKLQGKIVKTFVLLISFVSVVVIGLWISTQKSFIPETLLAYNKISGGDCKPAGASCQFDKNSCCSQRCEEKTGVCLDYIKTPDKYAELVSFINSEESTTQGILPKSPEDSECEEFLASSGNQTKSGDDAWDWPLVNGYYCSYTDPQKLIYCEQHYDNATNKSYIRYDSTRSKNCKDHCIREPMGIDDHCLSDESTYSNYLKENKFFKTEYVYNESSSEIHVAVNVLKNDLSTEMPTNSHYLYFEVSDNAKIIPPSGNISINGKNLYLINTASPSLIFGMGSYRSLKQDIFSYSEHKDETINYVMINEFWNLDGTESDGNVYTGFVVKRNPGDTNPVTFAISFRDKWKSFQCEMKTLFSGSNGISTGSDGLTVCQDRDLYEINPWGYPDSTYKPVKKNISTSNDPYISNRLEPYNFNSLKSKINGLKTNTSINQSNMAVSDQLNKNLNASTHPLPFLEAAQLGDEDLKEDTTYSCGFLCKDGSKPTSYNCVCAGDIITEEVEEAEFKVNSVFCGSIDEDGNNILDIEDLAKFANIYGKSCNDPENTKYSGCGSKDVNGNGVIDSYDFDAFSRYYFTKIKFCNSLKSL